MFINESQAQVLNTYLFDIYLSKYKFNLEVMTTIHYYVCSNKTDIFITYIKYNNEYISLFFTKTLNNTIWKCGNEYKELVGHLIEKYLDETNDLKFLDLKNRLQMNVYLRE